MTFRNLSITLLIVLAISIGFILVVPVSQHNIYIINLVAGALIMGVYVASWDLLAGYTGLFNMGQLIFAGIPAYVVALIETNFNLFRPITILIGFSSAIIGVLLVVLPSLRVRSFYFALVTFVTPLILHTITMSFPAVFGGEYGLSKKRIFSPEVIYYATVSLFAVALITLRVVVKSRIGLVLQAIREDEETARSVGVNVFLYKLLACTVSGTFTSLAGILYFYYMGHVDPSIFGLTASFMVVVMGIVGGMGNLFGPAFSGGILSIVLEYLRPIGIYRELLYGCLFVAVIMLMPQGIGGAVSSWYSRKFRKKGSS